MMFNRNPMLAIGQEEQGEQREGRRGRGRGRGREREKGNRESHRQGMEEGADLGTGAVGMGMGKAARVAEETASFEDLHQLEVVRYRLCPLLPSDSELGAEQRHHKGGKNSQPRPRSRSRKWI